MLTVLIPLAGLRLNVTATLVNTLIVFLCFIREFNTFVVRAYMLNMISE